MPSCNQRIDHRKVRMSTATLSSKFQISVPKEVRDALVLAPGQKLEFINTGSAIKLVPQPRLAELVDVGRGANTTDLRDRNERRSGRQSAQPWSVARASRRETRRYLHLGRSAVGVLGLVSSWAGITQGVGALRMVALVPYDHHRQLRRDQVAACRCSRPPRHRAPRWCRRRCPSTPQTRRKAGGRTA